VVLTSVDLTGTWSLPPRISSSTKLIIPPRNISSRDERGPRASLFRRQQVKPKTKAREEKNTPYNLKGKQSIIKRRDIREKK